MTNAGPDNPNKPADPAGANQGRTSKVGPLLLKWVLPVVLFLAVAFGLYWFAFEENPVSAWWDSGRGGGADAGVVEVDNPEVYTRERLVNDRFIEDNALRALLKEASSVSIGPSLAMTEQTSRSGLVQFKPGEAAPATPTSTAPQQQSTPALPEVGLDHILSFKAHQLYRQTIRQAIIENQLDDTHDLLGNSLYLFKFDASILPGAGNRQRLRIDMELSDMSNFHQSYDITDLINKEGAPNRLVLEADRIYDLWLEGTNAKLDRLRLDLHQAFKRNIIGDAFSQDVRARFRTLFGFSLPGPAGSETALLESLAQVRPAVVAKMQAARQKGYPGDTDTFDQVAAIGAKDCVLLDLLPPSAGQPDQVGTSEPAPTAADAKDTSRPSDAPPAGEVDPDLDIVSKCLSEWVITNWAIRINFGVSDFSSANARTIWDYARPIYRDDLTVELGRRIDPYFVSFPEQIEKCSSDPECFYFFLVNYRHVGSLPLDIPTSLTVRQAVARAAERNGCDATKLTPGPSSERLLIYAFSGQSSNADSVGETFRATPLPPAALLAMFRTGAFHCSKIGEDLNGFGVSFERGLFNFIEKIQKESTGYSYSVMPREDLRLISHEVEDERDFGAEGSVGTGVAAGLSERRSRAARAMEGEATIVGFGSSRSVGTDNGDPERQSVKFGWLVWPGRRLDDDGRRVREQLPMQKSLSVLVSIPAWWERVRICGGYRWLDEGEQAEGATVADSTAARCGGVPERQDGDSAPSTLNRFEYEVALPFEIATLDPVLFGTGRLADPKIFDWAMGDIQLTICEPASIIIPGQRLWRSAMVTLGSQQAEEIIVLPNMEGIIAKFDRIQFPNGASRWQYEGGSVNDVLQRLTPTRQVALTVWTSEGNVQHEKPVWLRPPTLPENTALAVDSCEALDEMRESTGGAAPQPEGPMAQR